MKLKKSIALKDLKPKRATFKLDLFPDFEFKLRPFALADEVWLSETFGKGIEQAFQDRKSIAMIAWHQLENREKFKKQEVKIVNDEGDEITQNLGGFNLFATCICGAEEQVELVKAIMHTLGISQPIIDELSAESEKKSTEDLQQKLTGEKSSIFSETNTDIPGTP